MNPSDWNPVSVTLAGLGVSGVVVVALAELVARRRDRAQTQRAVWIAAATLMLGLTLAEWFGARAAVELLWSRAAQPKTTSAVVSTAAATLAPPPPLPAPGRVMSSVIVTAQPMAEVAMSSSRVAGWLSVVWLVGAALLLMRCGVALGLLPWVRRKLQPVRDTELLSLAKDVRERLGMKQIPELRQGRVASPMTFGLFRPVVCLPEQFGVDFPADQRRAVLAHEFAHVASLDTLWRCLAEVLAALLWWHPAVWVIRRRLHRACEFAADEASRLAGPVQASLAEALVALAAKPGRVAPWPMLAAAGDGYHSDLGQRVERLLDSPDVPPALPKAGWRWSVGALLTAVVLMTGLSACHTGSESPIKQAGTVLRADQPSVPPPTEGKPQSSSAYLQGIYDVTGTAMNNEARETDLRKDLITRTFKVDPNEFVHGLSNFMAIKEEARKVDDVSQLNFMEAIKEASGRPRDFHGLVRGYFTVAGVDLSPPKAIHFNDRTGLLIVKAAAADLEVLQTAIEALNTSPKQIAIEAKWIEVTDAGMNALPPALRSLRPMPLGARPIRRSGSPKADTNQVLPDDLSRTNVNVRHEKIGSELGTILDPKQAKALLESISGQGDAEVISMPRGSSLDGRQLQTAMLDIRTVVTGVSFPADGTDEQGLMTYQTEAVLFGPVLDIVPSVVEDGKTIDLTSIARKSELLGYEDPGPYVPTDEKRGVTGAQPYPIIRTRTFETYAAVPDGYSLLLGGVKSEVVKSDATGHVPKGRSKVTKHLFVLITPTIIDPAGNRVYSDEDVARAQKPSE